MLRRKIKIRGAFTIIELLTVISVIALLMAIFGTGANKVRKISQDLSQKAQIHSMEVGLELFSKDFGRYPESAPVERDGGDVYGAQHLTEALFGRDLGGIEVNSKFHRPGDGEFAGTELQNYYDPEEDISKNRRKGPYMQFGKGGVNAVYMKGGPEVSAGGMTLYADDQLSATNIYASNSSDYAERAPVITDIYKQKKITINSGETSYVGTPILYYRANRSSDTFRPTGASYSPGSQYYDWIYNYYDNYGFYKLPSLKDPENPEVMHHFDDSFTGTDGAGGIETYYEYITNEKVEAYNSPQNRNGFIIISAGRDGVYGTNDDITNFDN